MDKSFYSKILLFGEYSIIKDSMALAIPYPLFEGKLVFPRRDNNNAPDQELKAFAQYLKKKIKKNKLLHSFDLNSFEFDIDQGLTFDSTIPRGLGLGSSGALCAAVFERYGQNKKKDKKALRQIFSSMESHFHGISSGLDPIISFLNQAILVREKGELNQVNIPSYSQGQGGIFLLNTGRARRTEPLVNLFLEKSKDKKFNQICQSILIPHTNRCITHFLEKNERRLLESFYQLSRFQWEHLTPMIPPLFQEFWHDGLLHQKYFFKLCGAGGGGFLLGITKDLEEASKSFNPYQIKPLFRFNFQDDLHRDT